MTKNNGLFSTSFADDEEVIVAIERIRLKHKRLRLVVYRLENGETAVTTRQMAISVKKPLYLAKGFGCGSFDVTDYDRVAGVL